MSQPRLLRPLTTLLLLLSLLPLLIAEQKAFSKLVWSDEFEGDGSIDESKWMFDTFEPMHVNKELQKYTKRPENVRTEDGKLVIEAHNEYWNGYVYTSGRLSSYGKFDFTYGRVEVRAKLPSGRGSWPAIWMLGADIGEAGWPACGEIDIMEHVGYEPGVIHGSAHATNYYFKVGSQQTATTQLEDFDKAFHIYAVEWHKDHIDYFVDGKKFLTVTPKGGTLEEEAAWPFDSPQFILLNIAVGGAWGGIKGIDESAFPMRMEIDYVRVYQ